MAGHGVAEKLSKLQGSNIFNIIALILKPLSKYCRLSLGVITPIRMFSGSCCCQLVRHALKVRAEMLRFALRCKMFLLEALHRKQIGLRREYDLRPDTQ